MFLPDVGRFMSADLSWQGFRIMPKSTRSQQIPKGGQAIWLWEVTALQPGKRSLTLTTVVEGLVGGSRHALANTQEVRTVVVEVSWPDRLMDGLEVLPRWLKAVTALMVALGALLAAWIALRATVRKGLRA